MKTTPLHDHGRTLPESTSPPVPGGRETILLVEDDPLVREHAENLLESLGYSVISAGNGPEALRNIEPDVSVDLIFTDMVMPGGMTGRALAARLARSRPGIPVLYTSGYSENAYPASERAHEDIALLPKPYRRRELAAMIREALDRRGG